MQNSIFYNILYRRVIYALLIFVTRYVVAHRIPFAMFAALLLFTKIDVILTVLSNSCHEMRGYV